MYIIEYRKTGNQTGRPPQIAIEEDRETVFDIAWVFTKSGYIKEYRVLKPGVGPLMPKDFGFGLLIKWVTNFRWDK